MGALVLGAVAGTAACGSSGGTGGSGSASGSVNGATGMSGGAAGTSGGLTSGTTGGSGTSSGAATGGPPPSPPAGAVVLDDMTMQQSVTLGSWYTYSDRSIPNSEPPIIQGSPPGSITPAEGAPFNMASTDSRGPTFVAGDAGTPTLWPYREVKGGGESMWGAGFGMDIHSSVPDGGPVGFNSCPSDAGMPIFVTSGPNVGSTGIPVPFDAIAAGYKGISFYGTSFGPTTQSVNVQLDDARTSPWGGSCAICQNGGKCAAETDGGKICPCSDSYIATEAFPSGSWKLFTIHWTDMALATANWSTQGLGKGTIDAKTLYNLHFQLSTGAGKALGAFDIGVAYITWLTQ